MIESPAFRAASPVPTIIYRDDANSLPIQMICKGVIKIALTRVTRLADNDSFRIFRDEFLNKNARAVGCREIVFIWIRRRLTILVKSFSETSKHVMIFGDLAFRITIIQQKLQRYLPSLHEVRSTREDLKFISLIYVFEIEQLYIA